MPKAQKTTVKDERPVVFQHFDTAISRLGEAKVDSPIRRIPLFTRNGQLVEKSFVQDSEQVLVYDSLEYLKQLPPKTEPLTFELSGPRPKIYFDPSKLHCAIATCGGLCPGINDVIRAIVLELHYIYGVRHIYGVRYGFQGFIPKYGHDLMNLTPEAVADIHTGARGAYGLATALPSIQVPPTVQAVLAARMDRLPPEEKRLLQAAAVVGKDVAFPLLQAIAELPEEALRRDLSQLQSAEFLYETSLYPDLEYTFKHALTHQVAYGSLLQERRRTLHARIVGVIEQLYPDRLAEQVDRLSHHALRGEVWEKAEAYLRQAGEKATARSAYREAVARFEQALAALAHLPETRERLGQAIDLRLHLYSSLNPLAEFEKLGRYLREAEGLARTLNDQRRLGRVLVSMGYFLWITGRSAEARTAAQSAQAIGETLGEVPLEVGGNHSPTCCMSNP